MKKLLMILPLALTLCFMVGCKGKKANVEKFMENGVEPTGSQRPQRLSVPFIPIFL